MDKFYLIDLYDIYGLLLSEKQQKYFEDYYFENLSLQEISENYNISRNAVHNVLKLTEEKLINYEECLKLKEKNYKIKEIINKIEDENIKKELEKLV